MVGTAMKDPKDILRSIKAEMKGVSPDDIIFRDLRLRKKNKKKNKKNDESESGNDRISNKEGFSIDSPETRLCGYEEIGKLRKHRVPKKKNSLEEWGAFDFFRFAHSLYMKRFGNPWDLKIGGNSLVINRIRDKFYDTMGYCCNLIMRDYIVFFFDNYISDFVKTHGDFYFSQMNENWLISLFRDQYDFVQSFRNYVQKERRGVEVKNEISIEGIQESFQIGDTTLLGNYGIVVALNWLVTVKKMDRKKATKLVIGACQEMHKRNLINAVIQSTELYSPYPDSLPFKSPDKLINRVDKSIKFNIEFNDNDRMQFLVKRG